MGYKWANSFKQHQFIRQWLTRDFPAHPVPSLAEWLDTFPNDSWMRHLPPREADVLCLHAHALMLQHDGRVKFQNTGFCWDIGWSIGFAQKKHLSEQHQMNCQLRSHRHWYQTAGRYLLGIETLYAHGFKRTLQWSLDGATPELRELVEAMVKRYRRGAGRPREAQAGEATATDVAAPGKRKQGKPGATALGAPVTDVAAPGKRKQGKPGATALGAPVPSTPSGKGARLRHAVKTTTPTRQENTARRR